jgi:hypothetical protein
MDPNSNQSLETNPVTQPTLNSSMPVSEAASLTNVQSVPAAVSAGVQSDPVYGAPTNQGKTEPSGGGAPAGVEPLRGGTQMQKAV